MTCLSNLIGVEFEYGGRGPNTLDCWGLVQECYWRRHGIRLPDYRSTASPRRNAAMMAREGSVLLIRVGRFGGHVGFVHKKTRFLQALEGFGVIESRTHKFERQIVGAYSYVGPKQDDQGDHCLQST
jgi:cell wall-associated NlpC family hydrolase